MTLRPYQARAIDAVRKAYLEGARRILLVAPTGAGKTRMMAEIALGAVRKGGRVLWVTHRVELVEQASAALEALGIACGVILAGRDPTPDAVVQVCSVQTLTARGEAPDDVSVICLDEAHHATAGTWRAIVEAYPGIRMVIGATATPERGDRPLGDVFDRLVVACTVRDLQELGALVPCDIIRPPSALDGLAEKPVEAYRRFVNGQRAIVFASNVAHAEALAQQFAAVGIPAACVHGNTPTRQRKEILEGLASGRIRVVTNPQVLTEGFDCPALEAVIMARGCSAWCTWIQCIGRGLRPFPGKTKCTVLDLRGAVYQHGFPEDEREFSLTGTASKAVADLPALVSCSSCGATFRCGPSRCPRCGRAAPPPPMPKLTRAPLGRHVVAPPKEREAYFDELRKTARERGYRDGWIGAKFRARYGVWPRGLSVGRKAS